MGVLEWAFSYSDGGTWFLQPTITLLTGSQNVMKKFQITEKDSRQFSFSSLSFSVVSCLIYINYSEFGGLKTRHHVIRPQIQLIAKDDFELLNLPPPHLKCRITRIYHHTSL